MKIRISDIVCDRKIRTRATVVQRKTGRPVQFELMTYARASLLKWLELRGGSLEDFAFPSRTDHTVHISARQYARLVDEWVTGIGLPGEDYGTHSRRRTKASIIYKATGNLRADQILLGHTKIESTVRYLGVDVEDTLTLAEGTEIRDCLAPCRRKEPTPTSVAAALSPYRGRDRLLGSTGSPRDRSGRPEVFFSRKMHGNPMKSQCEPFGFNLELLCEGA